MRGLKRISAAAVVVLTVAALAAGVAWAAPAKQPALVGKVTRVSVSSRFFVVNGKIIHVSKTTAIRVVGGGLVGLRVGRRVRVVVVRRGGKYYAVDVRLVRIARVKARAQAKPTFTG